MTIATGVAKQLRYKKESAYGTAPGATGAQLLRRVTSDLSLTKDTYQSNEIRSDYQIADMRHGTRKVSGNINGELSLTSFQDFFAAILRKAWVAGESSGSISDVTATVAAPNFVRATGSWITDGFKVGDVVRWTGWTTTGVNNNDTNMRITALTATDMTVAETVAAKAAGDSVTCAVPGKKLWVPTSSHTDDSFSIEHWHSDINQSELFLGCKLATMGIQLPPTGMATINMSFFGKNITTDTSAYYTSPTAETTTAVLAAVNGTLMVGGTDIAVVTGMNINIDGGVNPADPVVGSNSIPDVFQGRVRVSGQLTAYFEDATLRDYFLNETEFGINCKFDATSDADTDFMSFYLGRCKAGGSSKDDGEKGLVQTIPFEALLYSGGGTGTAYDDTTIAVIDSAIS